MMNEDYKTREDIMKQLLALATEANDIKEYDLGEAISTAYNLSQDQLDIEELRRLRDHSVLLTTQSGKGERLTQVFKGDHLVASVDSDSASAAKDYRILVNGHQLLPRL